MYMYKLLSYDFEGYDNETFIKSSMNKKDFEKLLIKINLDLKKEDMTSNIEIFEKIISVLVDDYSCEIVCFYDEKYILQDRCPLPNSTNWVVRENILRDLNENTNIE